MREDWIENMRIWIKMSECVRVNENRLGAGGTDESIDRWMEEESVRERWERPWWKCWRWWQSKVYYSKSFWEGFRIYPARWAFVHSPCQCGRRFSRAPRFLYRFLNRLIYFLESTTQSDRSLRVILLLILAIIVFGTPIDRPAFSNPSPAFQYRCFLDHWTTVSNQSFIQTIK